MTFGQHKPPLSQSPVLHAHRRHQSAPTIQIQMLNPTRTPGLLAISKQTRPPLVKRKPLLNPAKSTTTVVVRPSLLNLTPPKTKITTEDNKSDVPASPFRQRRGRGQVKNNTKGRVQNHHR